MEQYLRAFCGFEQDDWVTLLPSAEFAYNDSVYSSTHFTPFMANQGYNPYRGLDEPGQIVPNRSSGA